MQISKYLPTQTRSRPSSIMHSAQYLLMHFKYLNRKCFIQAFQHLNIQHHFSCELKTTYLTPNFKVWVEETRHCSSNNMKWSTSAYEEWWWYKGLFKDLSEWRQTQGIMGTQQLYFTETKRWAFLRSKAIYVFLGHQKRLNIITGALL